MKTIKLRKKWNISRVFYKELPTITNKKSNITYEQAKFVSSTLNSYNDRLIIPEDVLRDNKNYIFESDKENAATITGVAKLQRKNFDICIIHDMYVHEPYRLKGYGRSLFTKIEERAYKRNFKKLSIEVPASNTSLTLSLEKYGMKKIFSYHSSKLKDKMYVFEKEIKKPD